MDKKIGRGSSNNDFYNDDHKWDSQDSSHFDNKCCIHIENKNESKKSINKEKMDSDKNKRVKSEKNKVDGLSYWWDVFVCFVINVCIQTIESFVDIGIHDQRFLRTFDVNETEVQQVNNYFKSMIDFFAPIGVFVMTKFGQRTNIVAGSLLICASFTGISFLDSRSVPHSVWYWKIGICGPAGFGISLLKIGALVPVLEYFTKRRMEALLLTKVGFVLGYVIDMGAKFAGTLHWTTLYRINAGLCAFPLVFVFKKKFFMIKVISEQEIEKKRNTNEKAETKDVRENNCKFPCLDKVLDNFPVLKRKTLWTVVGVFSTFRFGTSLTRFSQSGISKKIKGHIESTTDSFVEDLTVIIGTLVGIILSYLARKCSCLKRYRRRGLDFAFTIVSIACQVIGFSSAVTSDKVGYHIYFNLILMALKALSENIRTEAMPDVLGRSNIRITEGLLHMFTGLAGIVAETVHNAQRTTDGQQDWKKMFKIGGGCLLMNGLLSEVYVMSMLFKHPRKDEDESNEFSEDGNEFKQENEDSAVVENSSNENTIKSKLLASQSTNTNILTLNKGTMTEQIDTMIKPLKIYTMTEPLTINVNPLPYSQPTYSKERIPASTPSRNSTISPGTVASVIDCPRYAKALMPPYKRTFPKNM